MFVGRLLDAESNTVEEVTSPDPREIEKFVRRTATHIAIVDDARYEGTGAFIGGSIEWFDRD